jgi:hypothetical protein
VIQFSGSRQGSAKKKRRVDVVFSADQRFSSRPRKKHDFFLFFFASFFKTQTNNPLLDAQLSKNMSLEYKERYIWQFRLSDGWADFSLENSKKLHRAYTTYIDRGEPYDQYLLITEPLAGKNKKEYLIDFITFQQTDTKTQFARKIRFEKPSENSNQAGWFFMSEHSEWTQYDSKSQKEIEKNYLLRNSSCVVKINIGWRSFTYWVNFDTGAQQNLETRVERLISRKITDEAEEPKTKKAERQTERQPETDSATTRTPCYKQNDRVSKYPKTEDSPGQRR